MSHPNGHNPQHGILWMLSAGLSFVVMTALVKYLGARVPPAQAAFLRYVLGLVFVLPMIRPMLNSPLKARHWKLFAVRGFVHSFGVIAWFYAMTQIPLADLTAMNYFTPIFITVGAALFLGEKLAMRRIAAIIVALIGAMIILRPGFREVNTGHLAMVFTTALFASSYMLAKVLADELDPVVVVGMLSIFVPFGLAPAAYLQWVTPEWWDILVLFCVACFATLGHYFMTLALRAAPMTVTQPVTFLQLIWAALMGVFLFGEAVDIWVFVGGGLIMASVSYISWREAALRKQLTPTVHQTKS